MNKLEAQLENILKLERLKECFELRLYHIRMGYATKSEYEKNEIEINELTTESEITKLDKILVQQTENFCSNIHTYVR